MVAWPTGPLCGSAPRSNLPKTNRSALSSFRSLQAFSKDFQVSVAPDEAFPKILLVVSGLTEGPAAIRDDRPALAPVFVEGLGGPRSRWWALSLSFAGFRVGIRLDALSRERRRNRIWNE